MRKKKQRIIFEIDDKKLRNAMKICAKKQGMLLKFAVETAFKEYLEKRT